MTVLKLHRALATFVAVMVLAALALAADSPVCPATATDDEAQVVQALQTMYAAATTDDLARFHAVVTPDFYVYDAGKRFDGDAIMTMVKGLHAAGNTYAWKVTDPEVHITCGLAWVTYVNRGSLQNASGKTDLTWLESAIVQKERGQWRVRFMQSTRVPQS
jgi:ketosteroid isomerase-like protein